MISLALRSMGERKLRSALTAFAVLLGVAMIAGTYVQTDRIRNAFEGITETAMAGVDAVVTRPESFSSDFSQPELLDERVVAQVAETAGVAHAEGQLQDLGSLVVDGEAVGSSMAPTLVLSSIDERFSGLRVTDGRLPSAEGEVVILEQLAEDEGLAVGDRAELSTRSGVQPVAIAGLAEFGDAQSIGGATIVVPRLEDMQRWYGVPGEVSNVVVAADDGVSPEQLVLKLRSRLPRDLEIETGKQNAQVQADEINDQIGGFLTPALAGAVRRRPARRRVHHLQHVLDHRRAADPGVRAAARDGRDATPDHGRCRRRGTGDRGGGLGGGSLRGPGHRDGARVAVRRGGLRDPHRRARARDAHDRCRRSPSGSA